MAEERRIERSEESLAAGKFIEKRTVVKGTISNFSSTQTSPLYKGLGDIPVQVLEMLNNDPDNFYRSVGKKTHTIDNYTGFTTNLLSIMAFDKLPVRVTKTMEN